MDGLFQPGERRPPQDAAEALKRLRGWLARLPEGSELKRAVAECLMVIERELTER